MFSAIGKQINVIWSQIVTLWLVFLHLFNKADTVEYPDVKPYMFPRWRGRIILTRDPDGEERCVACNLCAVACPVDCIALQKNRRRKRPLVSRVLSYQLFPLHHVRVLRRSLPDTCHTVNAGF